MSEGKGKDCIRRAVAAGLLDPLKAAKIISEIERIEFENFDALGPIGSRRAANADALAQARYEAAITRRATLMQLLAQDRIAQSLDAAQAARNAPDQASLLRGIVDSTGLPQLGFRGAQQEMKRVRSMAHAMMADALQRFHTLPGGFKRNRAQLANVVREIFGEETGDVAARQMAKAWGETAEALRRMFNAAGGAIPKLKTWRLPQQHNIVKVRKVSFEAWRDTVIPLLDREAMTDFATGKPLSGANLDRVLRNVYDTIRTDGFDVVEPSGRVRAKPIAARRQDSRILHFRDAQSWLAYHEAFGEGDPFAAMMHHIDGMARDIGAMRAMGPNPRATIRFLGERQRKAAAEAMDPKLENRANRVSQTLNTLYSHYIGDASAPVDGRWARAFSSTRQFLTAAQLGGAVLSAIGDLGFQRITAKFNGLPHWKIMARQVSLLNPANVEDRKLAVRLGLIAEEWSSIAAAQMRYTGEAVSGEITQRLADGVLRASGLSAWTQAGRWAFGMEFMGYMADHAGKAFGDLPKPLAAALDRYGVTAADWDAIRATPLYAPDKGGGFIRPDDLLSRADLDPARADELATKLLDMVQSETEFAVPSTSIVGKATLMGDARPGTIAGEFMRSTLMYKNFAITMFYTHLSRAAQQNGTFGKLRYFSSLVVTTTLMGALALQLKDVARGKDPRPMMDPDTGLSPKFLGAAMLQGGGLGIFGDFLFAETSRFGGGLPATTAGPIVGFAGDVLGLTFGNAYEAATGQTTNAGREAVQFAGRYTPGASLWYLRLGIERGILDAAQRMVDPNAEKSFAARRQSWGTEQGADFWMPPGEGYGPQRAPDWMNALRSFEEGKTAARGRRANVKVDGQDQAAIEASLAEARRARRYGLDPAGRDAPGIAAMTEAEKARRAAERKAKKATRRTQPRAGVLEVPAGDR